MRPPQLKQQESTPEMWEIVQAGGALMWPIMLCSVVAAAIILERLWTLQDRRVLPPDLMQKVWRLVEAHQINDKVILALEHNSPLGRLLAAGLKNRHRARDVLMERLEDTGRHVVHELERFLNTLGTIAGVSPLLGLLGTVTGIIKAFNAINAGGAGDPRMLSGGIAEALVATAAGLCVAIPSLIGYRYLRGRVEGIVVEMEKNALRLVDAVEDAAADAAAAEGDEAQEIAAPAALKQGGARRPPDSAAAPVQPAPPAQHIAQA
ncbi:MAG: MotA/TolQ/ExbB proton channel family protein [Steroidobacterales bacterium]